MKYSFSILKTLNTLKKKYEEHQPILAFSEVAHRARPIADN